MTAANKWRLLLQSPMISCRVLASSSMGAGALSTSHWTQRRTLSLSTPRTNQQAKLIEVGLMNHVKIDKYPTGQIFLHKLFGYRGVVLFSWTANVFEMMNATSETSSNTNDEEEIAAQYNRQMADELENSNPPDKSRAKKENYYQVLIDARDIPHVQALHPEAVVFLRGPKANRAHYSIPGLDYASHTDILPYTSTEKMPIAHDFFDKFVVFDPLQNCFVGRDSLKSWKEGDHSWLELSDIVVRTTHNIKITVIPFYVGVKEDQKKKVFWWRYLIRIENLTPTEPVTLRQRNWNIFSEAGSFETVRGNGVVGKEPLLDATNPVFQYSSYVNLQAPSGKMWGSFAMERANGQTFHVRIPSFYLECKEEDSNE